MSPLSPTKLSKAQLMFDELFLKVSAKSIKSLFVSVIGLTVDGANTYYYKLKSEFDAKCK